MWLSGNQYTITSIDYKETLNTLLIGHIMWEITKAHRHKVFLHLQSSSKSGRLSAFKLGTAFKPLSKVLYRKFLRGLCNTESLPTESIARPRTP